MSFSSVLLPSSSSFFCVLHFLRQDLSLDLEFTDSVRLAGQ